MRGKFWMALLVLAVGLIAVVAAYLTVPNHTTEASHFDTLIVLGCPADPDGKVSSEERERVTEAVREFRAGARGAHDYDGRRRSQSVCGGRSDGAGRGGCGGSGGRCGGGTQGSEYD